MVKAMVSWSLFQYLGWGGKVIDQNPRNRTNKDSKNSKETKDMKKSKDLNKKMVKQLLHFAVHGALSELEKQKKDSVTLELFRQYLAFLKEKLLWE